MMEARQLVTGFNHSGVVVQDLQRMIDFYCDVLGLEVLREVDSIAPAEGDHTGIPDAKRKLVFVGKPGDHHQLELVCYLSPKPNDGHLHHHQYGSSHVCFNVADLQDMYESLPSRGLRFITEPKYRTTPEGARIGICYALDPEGNYLEFLERTEPAE
jgi:catechol 2,3-dioxygenase-like lactoylglutathione lyase family enzyme